MSFISSAIGSTIGLFFGDHSYWAVKLVSDTWQCENDTVYDIRQAQKRKFDWTLDLVSTNDVMKIKELWLFCPPNPTSPLGNTAMLPITEPGTAFQFKVATIDAIGSWGRTLQSHIIGRVDDKCTGDCTYFVWDAPLKCMSTPMKNNIYNFQSWRPEIGHIGKLSIDVLGLHL